MDFSTQMGTFSLKDIEKRIIKRIVIEVIEKEMTWPFEFTIVVLAIQMIQFRCHW